MHSRGAARQAVANAIGRFTTQMLPNYSQLVQHAEQGRSRADRGERIAAPPTQMLANQRQVAQHA